MHALQAVPGTNSAPDSIGEIQGCDGFNPEILNGAAASQVRAPGEWFTSADQLNTYLAQSFTCSDDCWEMPLPVLSSNTADAGPYCRFTWAPACDNTAVTTNAKDRCGNTASSSFNVRFDDTAPVVNVTLGAFTQSTCQLPHTVQVLSCLLACKPAMRIFSCGFPYGVCSRPCSHPCTTSSATEVKAGYETVPLAVTVTDDCGDANTLVSIEIFSDEIPLSTVNFQPSAALGRTYGSLSAGAALTGWTLTLSRRFAKSRAIDKDWAAFDYADGRYYTVRVCAQDLAGNIGCDEASIAVPLKGTVASSHALPEPVNGGKVYSVASDIVYWGQAQTDLPFRLRNTGLGF